MGKETTYTKKREPWNINPRTADKGREKTQHYSWSNVAREIHQESRVPFSINLSHLFNKRDFKLKTAFVSIGNKTIPLPHSLKNIANAITRSTELLNLQDDWDAEGANATDIKTLEKACNFLVSYSQYILKEYKEVIDEPDIDIMRDGSISILWETPKATFLIIFKKNDNEYSYFYGEEKIVENNSKVPFKYAIKNEKDVDKITALWMLKYLT